MSEYIHKGHNVRFLLCHLVLPAKYRQAVFDKAVDKVLKDVCLEIEKGYQVKLVEFGVNQDLVHFLLQSVPTYSAMGTRYFELRLELVAYHLMGRWVGGIYLPFLG